MLDERECVRVEQPKGGCADQLLGTIAEDVLVALGEVNVRGL